MSDFVSNQNKGIIWEILIEQKLFEGIDQKHKNEIKELFENTVLMIESQGKGLSLIEKNKEVIKIMVLKLEAFKGQSIISKREYTSEELQKERQKAFDTKLKKKQTEYDGMNVKIPEKIDFSDKLDEKIGDKMDSLLAEAIASRERQLNQVIQTHNPETASKWIVGESGNNSNEINNFETQPKNLKIGNETQIQDNQIVILDKTKQNIDKKMKVSFNESNNEIHNFSKDSPILSSISPTSSSYTNVDIGTNLFKILKKEPLVQNNIIDGNNISINKIDTVDQNIKQSNIEITKDILQDVIDTKREILLLKNEITLLNNKMDTNLNKLLLQNNEIIESLKTFVKL